MNVLGIVFSPRKNGNCFRTLDYCLSKLNHNVEIINIGDYNINPCGSCNYDCFKDKCPINDDIIKLYQKCFEKDIIIYALPTYAGNLPSTYFMFSERSQSIFMDNKNYHDFLKKVNIILIGNLASGGDMALHEAMYPFNNQSFYPEVLLLSSRDYNQKSIEGNLIENKDVKRHLDEFASKIDKRL